MFLLVDYMHVFGNEPSAIEMVFAIFANVVEFDDEGNILNYRYAQKRATDYLRAYCTNYTVEPPYEPWETELHGIPEPGDR